MKLKEKIDLIKEIKNSGFNDVVLEEFDVVSEIRFLQDNRYIRICWLRKKVPYFVDINIMSMTFDLKRAERFEDKTIFKYGLTYHEHQDALNKFLGQQLSKGSILAFPEKEF